MGELLQTKQAQSWAFQAPRMRSILELQGLYRTPCPSLTLHMKKLMSRKGKGPGKVTCWAVAESDKLLSLLLSPVLMLSSHLGPEAGQPCCERGL